MRRPEIGGLGIPLFSCVVGYGFGGCKPIGLDCAPQGEGAEIGSWFRWVLRLRFVEAVLPKGGAA